MIFPIINRKSKEFKLKKKKKEEEDEEESINI
jgi:hypothetical protein